MSLTSSFVWSFIERFGTVFLTFFFNWLLSRFFLTPSDFGIIGMLYVFIALANATVIGGFGQALIQKEKPTFKDYNTVFVWNVVLGLVLYLLLYITAPFIASYYSEPKLISVLRILSLTLILNSLIVVQNNILIKNMNFSKLAKISLSSALIGYTCGTFLAYLGYGVWSLVANTLLIQLVQVVLLWITSSWKPSLAFDKASCRELFSFGGFMYLSSLLENLYNNFSYLIIGRLFPSTTLGYFTQAEKLQNVPTSTISTVINQVTFPLYSSIQSDKELLKEKFCLNICLVSYLNTSLMLGLYLVASPLILFIFSDKWYNSIEFFQILCIAGILFPINTANTTVLKSMGKGQTFFLLQVFKRISAMSIMVVASCYGLYWILYSICISYFIFWILNSLAIQKNLGYPFYKQLYDFISSTYPISIAFLITYFITRTIKFGLNHVFTVLIICIIYVLLLLIFSYMLNNRSYNILVKYLKYRKNELKI